MKLLTNDIRERLISNGRQSRDRIERGEDPPNFKPVVKLFTPDAGATWLLTELDPDDPDIAWGLCDLGLGCAELGTVRISEIEAVRGPLGLPVERDRFFEADRPISQYATEAQRHGRIQA